MADGDGVPLAAELRPMEGPILGDAGEDACRLAILPVRPIMVRVPGSGEWLNERRLGEQWRLTAGCMDVAECVEDGVLDQSAPGLSPRVESRGGDGRPSIPITPASAGCLRGGGRWDELRGGADHSHG